MKAGDLQSFGEFFGEGAVRAATVRGLLSAASLAAARWPLIDICRSVSVRTGRRRGLGSGRRTGLRTGTSATMAPGVSRAAGWPRLALRPRRLGGIRA